MPSQTLSVVFDGKADRLDAVSKSVEARVKSLVANVDATATNSMRQVKIGAEMKKQLGEAGTIAGGSFFTRFLDKMKGPGSGSMSQLVSVVSNTMSSLGSGINPARVLAQQLPNVGQALLTLSSDMIGLLKRTLFNPIAAGITGALIGGLVAWRQYRATMDFFTKNYTDSPKSDYIAAALQRGSALINIQREIESSVRRTAEAHDSAASSAAREADAVKAKYDHLRKMNQLTGGSSGEKSQRNAELDHAERMEMIQQKEKEKAALLAESEKKKQEAADILRNTTSQASEGDKIANVKKQLDDARASLAKIEESKKTGWLADAAARAIGLLNPNPLARGEVDLSKRGLMQAGSELTADGYTAKDYAAEEKAARALVAELEKKTKEQIDGTQSSKRAREEGERLSKEAQEAAKKATQIDKDLPQMRADAERDRKNALEALAAGDSASGTRTRGDLTANQRIGAYAGTYQPTMLNETKQIKANTAKTAEMLEKVSRTLGGGADFESVINRPFA